jgi:uncharacterized protein (TIGR02246 family)
MKRLVLVLCVAAAGCGANAGTTADSEVRAVIDEFYAAAQRRDWDAAAALLAPEFEILTDGAETFRKEAYVTLLKSDDLVVERMALRDVKVRVSRDRELAWSTFRGSFAMTSHGGRHDVETAETLLFRRAGDRWLIAGAHASVKPSAPPQPQPR